MSVNVNLGDPMVQAIAVPLVVGFVAVGLIRFLLGPVRGAMLASLGVGVGLLVTFALAHGMPHWPATSALSLFGWLLIGGLVTGFLLDMVNPPEAIIATLTFAVPVTLVFWLGLMIKGDHLNIELALTYGTLMGMGYLAFNIMNQHRDNGITAPIGAFIAALGLGLVGKFSGFGFSNMALALAASCFAFSLWNWPNSRFPWGFGGTLLTAGPALLIAATMVMSREKMGLVTLLALSGFLSKSIADWLAPSSGLAAPFIQILIGALPVLGGVALVYFDIRLF